MDTAKPRARGRDIGKTGETVARNLKRLRGETSLRELEDLLDGLGVKISSSGLQKIESGSRRVDTDEIIALSVALNVNPNALLLPYYSGDADVSHDVTAVAEGATGADVWAWADGWQALPQRRTDNLDIDESVTGAERGRLEAERRMGNWEFLGRVRPQGELASARRFLSRISEQIRKRSPGEWLSVWRHLDEDKPMSTRVASYPDVAGADIFKGFDRIRDELTGILSAEEVAPFVEGVLEKRAKNGND